MVLDCFVVSLSSCGLTLLHFLTHHKLLFNHHIVSLIKTILLLSLLVVVIFRRFIIWRSTYETSLSHLLQTRHGANVTILSLKRRHDRALRSRRELVSELVFLVALVSLRSIVVVDHWDRRLINH